MFVLTRFNTESLHRHISATYKFDNFTDSFVEILAAHQTPEGSRWYQGTADAVRQNLRYFLERPFEHYLILSGDQLYSMDYGDLIEAHLRIGADMNLGTTPVDRRPNLATSVLCEKHFVPLTNTAKDTFFHIEILSSHQA